MDGYEFSYAQQGWQCPICKRVYSPLQPMCMYCGNENIKTSTGLSDTKSITINPVKTENETKMCDHIPDTALKDYSGFGFHIF